MAKKNDGDLLDSIGAENESVDLLDEISEDAALPPAWDPKEAGEGVQGVVTERTTMTSKYTDEPTQVVVLKKADGEKITVYGSRTRSRAEIEEKDPQIGDTFAIKYLGVRPRKDGNGEYHNYRAAVRRAATPAPAPATSGKPPF